MKKIYQSARKSLDFRRLEIKEIRIINDARDRSATASQRAPNLISFKIFKIKFPRKRWRFFKLEIKKSSFRVA